MKNAIDFLSPPTTILSRLSPLPISAANRKSGCFAFLLLGRHLGYLNRASKAKRFEHLQLQPGGVEFVPGKSMARRRRMSVMIVVPSFSKCEKCYPPVVPRVVASDEAPRAPHMRGRIHEPGSMEPDNHTNASAPEKH